LVIDREAIPVVWTINRNSLRKLGGELAQRFTLMLAGVTIIAS
jgi:hypothetical protein